MNLVALNNYSRDWFREVCSLPAAISYPLVAVGEWMCVSSEVLDSSGIAGALTGHRVSHFELISR